MLMKNQNKKTLEYGKIKLISENFDVTNWSEYLPPLVDNKVTDLQKMVRILNLITRDISEGKLTILKLWSVYGNIIKVHILLLNLFRKQ